MGQMDITKALYFQAASLKHSPTDLYVCVLSHKHIMDDF